MENLSVDKDTEKKLNDGSFAEQLNNNFDESFDYLLYLLSSKKNDKKGIQDCINEMKDDWISFKPLIEKYPNSHCIETYKYTMFYLPKEKLPHAIFNRIYSARCAWDEKAGHSIICKYFG